MSLRLDEQSEGVQKFNLHVVTPLLKTVCKFQSVVSDDVAVQFWSRQNDWLDDATTASSYFPTCVVIVLNVLLLAEVAIVTPATVIFFHLLIVTIVLVDVVGVVTDQTNSIFKDFVDCLLR